MFSEYGCGYLFELIARTAAGPIPAMELMHTNGRLVSTFFDKIKKAFSLDEKLGTPESAG